MSAARTRVVLAVCMLSAVMCAHLAQAAPAALVEFAIGNVSAVNGAGVARALSKGAEVLAGDTIDTGTGRAQLRFSDGAYISLQPGSQFRIDEYNYSGKNDDTERSFFSLLKGGLRTITGLIGRTNRRNYQVRVPVATIGIRGTEYTLLFDGSARGSVGEGEISVCNAGGCLNVTSGQSYFVAADSVRPELSSVRSFLSAPPLPHFVPAYSGDEPGNYAQSGLDLGSVYSTNDRVNPDGTRAALFPPPPLVPPIPNPSPDGPFGDQINDPQVTTQPVALATAGASFVNAEHRSDVHLTDGHVQGGRLISWSDGLGVTTIGTATVADLGNLGQIAWGRFTNGVLMGDGTNSGTDVTGNNTLHYVVGKPTPAVDLAKFASLSFQTVAGHTTPSTSNGTLALKSAGLNADLTMGLVSATVSLINPGKLDQRTPDLTLSGASALSGSVFRNVGTATGPACTANCTGDFAGMLAGPNAQYAGFTYDIQGTTFGAVHGGVVLRR